MVVKMDVKRKLSVNNEENHVSGDSFINRECQKKIFEAYFFILLEYLNNKKKFEIKANDLIYSDSCILISRSIQPYLMKRFHSYCRKLNIDYKSMNHIIPVDNSYSIASIISVVNNYRNPGKVFHNKSNAESDALKHHHSASGSILNPVSAELSNENFICINPRHYLISISAKSFSSPTNLSALLMEKNSSVRPPTLTPDGKRLNDLATVDCNLLKAIENASQIATDQSIFCEWGTVTYYELNSRVGDAFASATPIVTIDGYTSPSPHSSRFSLGHLTNVSRSANIERTRKFIGKGAKFYYIKGELFLECLSDNAIFVQSPMSNITSGWHPATVIKIPPKCNIKVFNEKDFKRILHQHELRGFEAVFALTPLCSIRISFVKGWGASYSRQTITATPCWVEVHLNQPLKCLDAALQRLETPSNQCSSRS